MPNFPVNFITLPQRRFVRGICIIVGILLVGYSFLQSLDNSTVPKTLWVIDNSLSMTVSDIKSNDSMMISRLDLAKAIIKQKSSNIIGDQAIMTAAQGARLELPMTDDRGAIVNVAQGITPIERGGGSLLRFPMETIRLIYGDTSLLQIIWITDGEFSDSGSTLTGFTNNPIITFIGVGTRAGGPILLGYSADGRPKYKESEGIRVNSVRDDTTLGGISKSLGAEFITLESDSSVNIAKIYTLVMGSTNGLSIYMVIGFFFVIIGLLYPRYQYLPTYSNGK